MGTTVNQKKLFFNLRKAKNKIIVLDEGDMRPDAVKIIARQLGVTQTDVNMLGGGDALSPAFPAISSMNGGFAPTAPSRRSKAG